MKRFILLYQLVLPVIFTTEGLKAEDFNTGISLLEKMADTSAVEKLVDWVWKHYPQNRISESRIRIAEEQLNQTEWSWFNALNFSYQYYPSFLNDVGSSGIDQRAGVGVSINVGSIISVPSKSVQAREGVSIEKRNLESQKLVIRREVIQRYARYLQQLRMVGVRQQGLVDIRSLLVMVKHKFEKGEESIEKYTNVLTTFAESSSALSAAEGDLISAKANMEELLGTGIEEVLN